MEAATENLQDEVGLFEHCQNLLSEIFSSLLLLFSLTGEPHAAALFHQVNILRGGGGRASVVSMAEGDESAYGSVSGRSSLVSTLDRLFILVKN